MTKFSFNRIVRLIIIPVITVLFISPTNLLAQTKSNKGTEFWLAFMSHIEDTDAGMSLYITSDSNTSGTVSIPGQSWSTAFTVSANNLTVVNIPVSSAYISCSDCIQSKGVKVVSNDNVVVYAHHYEGNKSDATLVLPSRTLGKGYYLMSYQESSTTFGNVGKNVFAVVAVKDNTKVNITPSTAINKAGGGTLPAGTTYQVTLDEGEVYHCIANSGTGDFTGTGIQVIDTGSSANCRTIAVFSGSTYSRIGGCTSGGGINSGDNLLEQMFPTTSWGSRFVLVPALGRAGDNFRFLASEDNTEIVVSKAAGAPDFIYLDAGEYGDITNEANIRNLVSNKPIMAAQFQRTSKCDGGGNRVGDPSMTILNPLEQTLKDITLYSSQYFDIDNHYINIVIPTWAKNSFTVDGSTATFTAVPANGAYSYARLSVSAGNHRLKADEGFIATAYGEGRYESYGYAAGANVKDLTAVAKVSNSAQNTEISNCIGRITVFNGSAEYTPTSWFWDFGDDSTSTAQSPSHLFLDTGTYLVKMYAYKPTFDGCSSYDSSLIEVKIYDKPNASISYDNLCDSSTIIFIDNSSIPSPEEFLTTRWSFDGGPFIYSTTASQYFDTTGKFNVFMEVTTKHYCRDTFQDSLTINPLPEPSFTLGNSCFYDSSFISSTTTISTGSIDQYLWDFNDGDSAMTESGTHYFQDSGWHYISLTTTSDSGCFKSISDSLYKHPRFEVSFSYNDTCLGFGNAFINTTLIDGGVLTDTTWYTSIPDTFGTYNLTSQFNTPGVYTIELQMEQDSFCRDTFIQDITIHSLVIPDFVESETCLGDSTLFTDASTISSGSYTLTWDWDDGFSGTGDLQKVKYNSGGVKSITLSATSDEGCVTDTTRNIVITYPEIVTLNLSDGCMGSFQSISSTNIMGFDSFISYDWRIDGISASTDSMFDFTSSTFGFITVELIVTTQNGCTVSLLDSFESFVAPVADFTVSSICDEENLAPIDISTISAPYIISGYKWSLDNTLVSTIASPMIPITAVGFTTLELIVESSTGCNDTTSKIIAVDPLPVGGFNVSQRCLGESTVLTSTATIVTGGISSTQWQIDGNSFSGTSVNYTFPAVGSYTVKQILTGNTINNCTDSVEQMVVINPLPEITIVLDSLEGCVPFNIAIENNSTISSGSISKYTWDWGNGSTSEGDLTEYTYNLPGSYTIKVIGESDQGCVDSLTFESLIIVNGRPIADFTFSPEDPSNITEFVTFSDASSDDAIDWNWSTSDGGSYTGKTITHSFLDSGNYVVTLDIVNGNGCEDVISKVIYVNADLFVHIPSAFSPNGDMINDDYGLGGLTQGVAQMTMDIFNRWGEKVFHSEDVNNRWDGTYNGEPAQQGVYVYMVRFTNPKQTQWYYFNGEIHLLR
ncbi:MAG: hypothetical protein COA58_03105 [Bacteroidetes bacterium]|nr:MAG: hypothetical protein COA58_03105 [Bacteroidota bacterium]